MRRALNYQDQRIQEAWATVALPGAKHAGATPEQPAGGAPNGDEEPEKLKMLAACRIELVLRGEKLQEPSEWQRRTFS